MLEAWKERGRAAMIHSVVSGFVVLYKQMQVSLQSVGQYNSSLFPDGGTKLEQSENWIYVQMKM